MPFASGNYLTTGQIAKDMGVCPRTVQKWIDSGVLVGVRFPTHGHGVAHRRVLKSSYDAFRRDNKFLHEANPYLAMAVGFRPQMPDPYELVVATSSFDAGGIVLTRSPQYIMVDWGIGRVESSQIAAGSRGRLGYDPFLVAVSALPPTQDMRDVGYRYCIRPGRSILEEFRVAGVPLPLPQMERA